MAKNKTARNLISDRNEYNAYYGDFRGVDFSSDHTQVANQRFAYLVNMYKDYGSANGAAVETIPGFRRTFGHENTNESHGEVNGIHKIGEHVFVHCGKVMYEWDNFPYSCGIRKSVLTFCGEKTGTDANLSVFTFDMNDIVSNAGGKLSDFMSSVDGYYYFDQSGNKSEEIVSDKSFVIYDNFKKKLQIKASILKEGDPIEIVYFESIPKPKTSAAANHKSISFRFGEKLMILDGSQIWVAEKSEDTTDNRYSILALPGDALYIPTTYHNLVQEGDNDPLKTEKDQRNLLSPHFKNEFYGTENDTQTLTPMSPFDEYDVVVKKRTYVEGRENETILARDEDYSVDKGKVIVQMKSNKDETFIVQAKYLDGESVSEKYKKIISGCTIACLFDNRIFLSGNKDYPNTVWFATPLDRTNYTVSFGANDSFDDGVNNVPITGMVPIGDNLLVLKETAEDGGAAFIHKKLLTEDDVVTKAYPREQGLQGIGCLGACANFFDDPVFVSKIGLSALGQLSVRNERALEHRSTLIDAKLTKMDLEKAFIEEWNGYLLLFVDGCMFMADSRQRYVDDLGVVQYEWYYIEGVGVYEGQTMTKEDGFVGGVFHPATCAKTINDNVFFGTSSGVVCAFNFDQRTEAGTFRPTSYTFDGRKIVCGCATKMDNCGIPHLTKSTVKKSMVIKIKSLPTSVVKVNVRTNRDPYKMVNRIGTALFSFEDMDFGDFSFLLSDSGLITVREKEKKWVEKQIYIYSDEYMKPFALFYMGFRYYVAGRFKN